MRQCYDYEWLLEEIDRIRVRYPATEVFSAGRSAQGRELMCISAGKGTRTLLLLGTHHAREYITAVLLMRLCEDYLAAAENTARVVFLPMVNPDGVQICIHGAQGDEKIAAMPRLNGTYSSWKANARGVDLNRNYPCLWEKKAKIVNVPASEMYNGPFAASEPEVRAVMRLAEELRPQLAVTFHTKGEEIYYADENTPQLWEESYQYAKCIREISGYRIMPPSKDPAVYAAGFENWFREQLKCPCILVEAGVFDGYEPFCEARFEAEIYEKLKNTVNSLLFV